MRNEFVHALDKTDSLSIVTYYYRFGLVNYLPWQFRVLPNNTHKVTPIYSMCTVCESLASQINLNTICANNGDKTKLSLVEKQESLMFMR